MHKIVTGTIAGAAGIALLLGGAGSFALWNDTASAAAPAVSSGTLSLSANRDGAWTDITNGRSTLIDPSVARMVPGNTYQFSQTLVVTATGQDLQADLTYAQDSITGDAGLIAATTRSLDVTSSTAAVARTSPTSNTFRVSPSDATSTITVLFTIALPEDATTGQSGTVDLGGLTFTLDQTAIGS